MHDNATLNNNNKKDWDDDNKKGNFKSRKIQLKIDGIILLYSVLTLKLHTQEVT